MQDMNPITKKGFIIITAGGLAVLKQNRRGINRFEIRFILFKN
jgi:hypothetical protein